MNLFATYESEVVDLSSAANAVLASAESGSTTRPDASRKLRELISECEENIVGMDMAVRNAPGNKRPFPLFSLFFSPFSLSLWWIFVGGGALLGARVVDTSGRLNEAFVVCLLAQKFLFVPFL